MLNATSGGVLLGTWGTSQWATWAEATLHGWFERAAEFTRTLPLRR